MWDWLAENSALVQAVFGGVTAFVWIFYLQILVMGLRRQRRTEMLIHLGGGTGMDARTFVSNLGFEPIYILEIMLTVSTSDGARETSIADRTEIAKENLASPSDVTVQGPLKSGEYVDIGDFGTLLRRAEWRSAETLDLKQITKVQLKVAAISAASSTIVAAERGFDVVVEDGVSTLVPQGLYAKQIRSFWARQGLKRELQRHYER
tara:strand:+ start:3707 stop:4324 length:618 start_codon:yes stop_codon:yes gene_type:complete